MDKVGLTTKNIAQFTVMVPGDNKKAQFTIDGQLLQPGKETMPLAERPDGRIRWMATFAKENDQWKWLSQEERLQSILRLVKRHPVQGPIDDAFRSPFLVVAPTGKSRNPKFQRWVDFELAHFCDRWRALMRGEPPVVNDVDFDRVNLGAPSSRPPNVVLWGDPDSNQVMGEWLEQTPVKYTAGQWTFGDAKLDGDRFVPTMVFPRQIGRSYPAYVVLNSGLTFREAHDRTNSQQNPKLPDWAIIDISQPPDANTPGRIHDADFFDEYWQLKRQPKRP
jgi:hypothetical protein